MEDIQSDEHAQAETLIETFRQLQHVGGQLLVHQLIHLLPQSRVNGIQPGEESLVFLKAGPALCQVGWTFPSETLSRMNLAVVELVNNIGQRITSLIT